MGTHPIFESDFDCLTERESENMSEIVYAAGEGPSVPRRASTNDVQDKKPIKMSRAKSWSQDVEEIWRFQDAGYRDQSEYDAFNPNQEITRWENGNIKKMQRKDGTWNYFDRERELFTNFHKVKIYQYQ